MSFSTEVKEQLSRLSTTKECCKAVEFIAFLRMSGNITFGFGGLLGISAATANISIAKRYFKLVRDDFGLDAEIVVQRTNKLKKNKLYTLRLPPQPEVKRLVELMSKLPDGNPWSAGQALTDLTELSTPFGGECCYRAYLRGAFLGNGFVNDPKKGYHLEVVCSSNRQAEFMIALMEHYGMLPKINERKGQAVVYLKESEQISDFLNVIGAHKALLDLETIRVYKERSNVANRVYNCDIANTNKIVNTGTRQLLAVRKLAESVGLDKLPPSLRETADLRLTYPDASLQELAEMFDPPLSKSGVNHRLRKLEKWADEL